MRGGKCPCRAGEGRGEAVSPIQSAFLNLKSAQRDCETAADFLGVLDKHEALVWSNNAIRQIESAKAKILASKNTEPEAKPITNDGRCPACGGFLDVAQDNGDGTYKPKTLEEHQSDRILRAASPVDASGKPVRMCPVCWKHPCPEQKPEDKP